MVKVVFKKNRVLQADVVVSAENGETILQIAQRHGIPEGSNCGGVCGCSTCHVYVMEGCASLEAMSEKEEDRLDRAFDVRLNSRLGCQAKVNGADLVIDISDESLKAFFDENPDIRKQYQETGQFKLRS